MATYPLPSQTTNKTSTRLHNAHTYTKFSETRGEKPRYPAGFSRLFSPAFHFENFIDTASNKIALE